MEPTNLNIPLEIMLKNIRKTLGDSFDVKLKLFRIKKLENTQALLVYLDPIVSKDVIHESILGPLMIQYNDRETSYKKMANSHKKLIDVVRNEILIAAETKKLTTYSGCIKEVLNGQSILFIEGCEEAISISTEFWIDRAVEEPKNEQTITGPEEGFNETIRTNCALIRRKIKNKNLILEPIIVGEETSTTIIIAYLKGFANENLIKMFRNRLQRLDAEQIIDMSYIEATIRDANYSLLPTLGKTQRPDMFVSKLLEGRVGLLCDGSPMALTGPFVFEEIFQSPEDYYLDSAVATFTRLIRMLSFLIAIFLPALYIAFVNYKPSVIPQSLLLSIAASRVGVPFSPFIEIIMMTIIFKILSSASSRLGGARATSISIVGAVLISSAVVEANLIEDLVIIIIAITSTASLLLPIISGGLTLLMLAILTITNLFGDYGFYMSILVLALHLCKLKSFGVPYLTPLSPLKFSQFKDTLYRADMRKLISKKRLLFNDFYKDFHVKEGDKDDNQR